MSPEVRARKQKQRAEFGRRVRERRLAKGIGLRELAKRVEMSPAYLSKIETGDFPPPIEKKVETIAKELDLNTDALLAVTEKVGRRVRLVLAEHPEAWSEFLRAVKGLPEGKIRELTRRAQAGTL